MQQFTFFMIKIVNVVSNYRIPRKQNPLCQSLNGYATTRLRDYAATRLLGYAPTWRRGCAAARLRSYTAAQLLGYAPTWLLG